MTNLDEYEQDILQSVENGEWKSKKNTAKKQKAESRGQVTESRGQVIPIPKSSHLKYKLK